LYEFQKKEKKGVEWVYNINTDYFSVDMLKRLTSSEGANMKGIKRGTRAANGDKSNLVKLCW